MAIKEELDVAGCVTTYGGRANTRPATADSEVVRRLRAAGAVIVGKTAMPEFGSFPFTESEHTGYTLNPWDESRSPGGSSGGTAVAVATGMVPVGLGGDGGGSIRVPSAFTGIFGLKPQRGRVTTAPHPHLWWALGVVGPLTRSVADSALVYDVVRGNLPTDLYRAGGDASFADAAAREPGTAADRLVGEGARPRRPQRPGPRRRRPRDGPAAHRPRPRRARGRPALPGPDGWRSCRSSSPASAPRPTRSTTSTGWSGVPARPTASARG